MDATPAIVTPPPNPAPADAPAATFIDNDLVCVECGYNLRAQHIDAVCPECGQPVRRTLQFPHLIRSAPRWLTSLRDSVAVMLAALLADVIGVIVADPRHPQVDMCLATVPWALAWFAVWLLTRPEPGTHRKMWTETRRWALRGFATMPYLAFYLDMSGRSTPWWYYRWWGPWVMLALMLGAAPATFLYYDHLCRSALRLPQPIFALFAGVTRWIVPLTMIGGVVHWLYTLRWNSMTQLLHVLPKPVLPGAQDAQFVWQAIAAGTDLLELSVLIRLVTTLVLLWSAGVLLLFFLAFNAAVRASTKGATRD